MMLFLIFMVMFAHSIPTPYYYELIYTIDAITEISGSITLKCRNQFADDLLVSGVKFWLNRTSACDFDLRERPDVYTIEVDAYSIKFNLTRNLEGHFTCGALEAQDNTRIIVRESGRLTLISLQAIVPVATEINFTATVGDTAVLTCPIPPGALLQSYSVIWMKDSLPILSAQDQITKTDPRYRINDAFSLIIESVDVNDSSSSYQCVMYSTNPITGVRQELQPQPERDILLSLTILETAATGEPESDRSTMYTGYTFQPEAPTRCHHLFFIVRLIAAGACVLVAISIVLTTITIVCCVKHYHVSQSRNQSI